MPNKLKPEQILPLLKQALKNVENDRKILLKEEVMESVKEWGNHDWSRTKLSFSNIEEISELFSRVERILRSRIVKPALLGANSSSFSQFYLKNSYPEEYKDKQEVVHTGDENMLEVIKMLNGVKKTEGED